MPFPAIGMAAKWGRLPNLILFARIPALVVSVLSQGRMAFGNTDVVPSSSIPSRVVATRNGGRSSALSLESDKT